MTDNNSTSPNSQADFLTDVANVESSQEQAYYVDHDHSWYVVSGATVHITNDLHNLAINSPYSGTKNLVVGNGNTLPISCVGHNSIYVSSNSSHVHPLLLNNLRMCHKSLRI